jgi:REP element-mobilizing transposase RayT
MAESKIHRGRRSLRVSSYDYAAAGWYYITICVHNRHSIFGSIKQGEIQLNRAGGIARDEWLRSLELRPGLDFDQWVIMPNHLHAIIVLPTGKTPVAGAHSCAPLQESPLTTGN